MLKIIYLLIILFINCLNPLYANDKEIPELISGWYFPSINNSVSRTDFQVALDFWMQEFTQNLDIKHTEVKLFDRIDEMLSAYKKGDLSLIIVPPLLLVKYFELNTLADGFTTINQTGKPSGMVVLARKDKNIWEKKDFENKRLVMQENDELADVYLDSLVIPHFHKKYKKVFNSVKFLKKQNAIIHSLFFDQADVGVVYLETFDLMNELNPQIKDKIKIMENFPNHSLHYSFFHFQFPEDQRKMIVQEALKLNHSVRAQEILSNFRMAAVKECSVKSLEPFIRLNDQYNKLNSQLK